MEKDVREHTEEKAGCQGAGEGTEDWKEKEKQQYLGGLRRLSEKGIAIYVDGRVSGPPEWEKLFEIRDDNMFYMGDYVQAESGGLKEVRFDKVYLSREDLKKPCSWMLCVCRSISCSRLTAGCTSGCHAHQGRVQRQAVQS